MSVTDVIETPKYRTKIIKAGALLTDTRSFFTYWDRALSRKQNLEHLQTSNVAAKDTRTRSEVVLAIFRQRYLADPEIAKALATFVNERASARILTPIFYFHAAQNDALLHDLVTEFLAPMQWQGHAEVTTEQVVGFLFEQVRARRTATSWSKPTARRVAQGLLATLRDFGILSGAMGSRKKYFTPMYLPIESFAYVAFLLNRRLRSGELLLSSNEWQLFFLSRQLVERYFIEAESHRLLTYNAAGSIIRVDFPTESIEEYAHTLAQRAH